MTFTQKMIAIVVGAFVVMTPLIHPRLSNIFFGNRLVAASAQQLWMNNDFLDYGYRLPPSKIIPEGPWLADYPALSRYTYDQVSILQSNQHYSVDLILPDFKSAQLLTASLNDPDKVTLFGPDEVKHSNGYYFEDRSLTNKYWVNISHYKQ